MVEDKQYTIKLYEEEIKDIIQTYSDGVCDISQEITKQIKEKFIQAKQKPYTNFDKIKDEISTDNLADLIENSDHYQEEIGCFEGRDLNICKASLCKSCIKKWLESKVENECN